MRKYFVWTWPYRSIAMATAQQNQALEEWLSAVVVRVGSGSSMYDGV